MADAMMRKLLMLRRIPRYPRKITVRALSDYLDDQGFAISERSVQRDLDGLSGRMFGLLSDVRDRPFGWSWAPDAAVLDIPSMEPQAALAFKLAEHLGNRLMAPSTVSALDPYFRQAETVLSANSGAVSAWPEKICTVTRGQTLMAPVIETDVLNCIYDGLFNDRQIQARYRRRYDGQVRDYVLSPLGIVFRDGVVYLVCQRNGQVDPVHLAMHRFIEAELLPSPVERPDGFDLNTYVREGELDFKLNEHALDVRLRVTQETAFHLQESPLSQNQRCVPQSDGRIELCASVADTLQFRWWLLGLGDQIEVIEPLGLRDDIMERLGRAIAQYQ